MKDKESENRSNTKSTNCISEHTPRTKFFDTLQKTNHITPFFNSKSHNNINKLPCSGLVSTFASMSPVALYLIFTSPYSVLSLIKK